MCGGMNLAVAAAPATPAPRLLRSIPSTDSADSGVLHTPVAQYSHKRRLTPEGTPPKRSRLVINAPGMFDAEEKPRRLARRIRLVKVDSSPSCSFTPCGGSPGGAMALEEAAIGETPSQADGFSDRAERVARMRACAWACSLVRDVLAAGGKAPDEVRLKAQLLACHRVQAFFMIFSMHQESPEVVALAAALEALQAVGSPCGVDGLLLAGEEAQQPAPSGALRAWVLEVAGRLRGLGGVAEFLPEQLLEMAIDFARRLAEGLPAPEASHAHCARLALRMSQVACCFLVDAHKGPDALRLPPQALAASAAVLAARFVLRQGGVEVPADECFALVTAADGGDGLTLDILRHVAGKIVDVNRLWVEVSSEHQSATEASSLSGLHA